MPFPFDNIAPAELAAALEWIEDACTIGDETDQIASFQRLRHLTSEHGWTRGDESVAAFCVRAFRAAQPTTVAWTGEQSGLPGSADELSIALADYCEAVKRDDDVMRRTAVAEVRRAVLAQTRERSA